MHFHFFVFVKIDSEEKERVPDFCEISGQTGMKRAAEVAAAGFHHLLMVGSPGSGKYFLGCCL